MKKKSFKWGYIILWSLAILFLISLPQWFEDSIGMGIVCLLFVIGFASLGCRSFMKAKGKESSPPTANAPSKHEKPKQQKFKYFDLENFKVDRLEGCFIFNDEFDYTVSEIKENCLEDWPIHKFQFDLKPEFTRTETGKLRIMSNDRFIGDLSDESALELKEFINSHERCTPRLEIQGGEYKLYDSDEKKLTKGRDPWTAKLVVSYYE